MLEKISECKQHVYRARNELDSALRASAAHTPTETYNFAALQQALEAIHDALDCMQDEELGVDAGLAPGAAPLSDLQTVPVRPAPPDAPEQAAGLAGWPGYGCAREPETTLPHVSHGIPLDYGAGSHKVPAPQDGDAGEREGLAGEACAGT